MIYNIIYNNLIFSYLIIQYHNHYDNDYVLIKYFNHI